MTNPSIASDLIERLTRTKQIGVMELSGIPIVDDVNPDGREAAEALSQLTREVDELREALHKIADDPYRYGIRVQKMKLIASEALSRSSGDAQ